jgi:hypothetical protein
LEYTDIPKNSSHIMYVTAALWSKATVAKVVQQWPQVILDLMLQPGWWKHKDVQVWWPRQGRGGPWGKAPLAMITGDKAPMNQASWGWAWVVKPQGLNNPYLEQALGALPEVPQRGLSPQKWPSPVGGKTPWGQSSSPWGLDDPTRDGRGPEVSKTVKARSRGQCHWGQSTKVRQPGGCKSLQGPLEFQHIMVKTLQGQKMDFQSPGGLDTG